MGNDGGTIANKRDLLVKTATQSESKSKEYDSDRLSTCPLSGAPLQSPIVCDHLGLLYNKDSVIEYILNKERKFGFEHIRSLKRDILDVKAHFNPNKKDNAGKFVCPLTGVSSTAGVIFLVMNPCGCLISEKAVVTLLRNGECPSCNHKLKSSPFQQIKIGPTNEELVLLRERLKKEEKLRKDKVSKEGVLSKPDASVGVKRVREDMVDPILSNEDVVVPQSVTIEEER